MKWKNRRAQLSLLSARVVDLRQSMEAENVSENVQSNMKINKLHVASVVETAIFHYYSPEMRESPTPAYTEAVKRLILDEILDIKSDNSIELTDKGNKWVEMMLNTPYPQREWVDPRSLDVSEDN